MSRVSQSARVLVTATLLFLVLTLVTGVLYPVAVTMIAQTLFPHRADGSLVVHEDGTVIGSELVAQPFDDPGYFWGRPSATGPVPWNAAASTGSNLGPTNPALLEAVQARVTALRAAHPESEGPIPVDLVTTSGSGLDPHISPAAAHFQVARVAVARGVDPAAVHRLVDRLTEGRTWHILGEPRVNVLALNLALDANPVSEHP